MEDIKNNTNFTFDVEIKDDLGQPKNITNWTIFVTIKDKSDKSDNDDLALVSKAITTHSDPLNGISVITIPANEMDMKPNVYCFGLKFKDENGVLHEPEEYPMNLTITDIFTKRNT